MPRGPHANHIRVPETACEGHRHPEGARQYRSLSRCMPEIVLYSVLCHQWHDRDTWRICYKREHFGCPGGTDGNSPNALIFTECASSGADTVKDSLEPRNFSQKRWRGQKKKSCCYLNHSSWMFSGRLPRKHGNALRFKYVLYSSMTVSAPRRLRFTSPASQSGCADVLALRVRQLSVAPRPRRGERRGETGGGWEGTAGCPTNITNLDMTRKMNGRHHHYRSVLISRHADEGGESVPKCDNTEDFY